MAKPVVATTKAIAGLKLEPGLEILCADEPADFATAVNHVVSDQQYAQLLGDNARQRIQTDYNWKSALNPLQRLLDEK